LVKNLDLELNMDMVEADAMDDNDEIIEDQEY